MFNKADNFKGFNVGQLIEYLEKIPKKTKVVLQMNDGEEPLNVIQKPNFTDGALMFNSFYEEEF